MIRIPTPTEYERMTFTNRVEAVTALKAVLLAYLDTERPSHV